MISGIHHIAIICSDYEQSKRFYTDVLGFAVVAEHFREEHDSFKCDLALNGQYTLELFSFPDPPARSSHPEAMGLRHLAFSVVDLDATITRLEGHEVKVEPVRVDEFTGKRFAFFTDPDRLPIEIVEK